jgi:hypothetical protein
MPDSFGGDEREHIISEDLIKLKTDPALPCSQLITQA